MQTADSKSKLSPKLKGFIAIGIVLILAVILFFLLQGKSKVTGAYPASIKTSSVVCDNDKISYPYTLHDIVGMEKEGSIRIIGTFDESKQANKISLQYTTYFSDHASATSSEAHMHAALAQHFKDSGLEYAEFDNYFSIVDKKVILNLYAPFEKVNKANYQFLMLKSIPSNGLSLSEFEQTYKSQGFTCVSTD